MRTTILHGVAVLAFFGCSTEGTPANGSSTNATDPNGVLPCDVEAVLRDNCQKCHASPPRFGAPMPLVTYGDLHARAVRDPTSHVFEKVGVRIHDELSPMPQPPNPRLDAHDTSLLDQWIAAGAPSGDGATCGDAGKPPSNAPALSCTPDVHMAPSSAYEMPEDSDDRYACYGFDVPVTGKRHVIAIAPELDNPGIIHHLVLFQSPTSVPSTPGGCDLAAMFRYRLLYGWAPGTGALELPIEAGYPVEGTAHFVVQLHYSNPKKLAGQRDASGFGFCTTDQLRAHDADALVFGDDQFSIAPRSSLTRTCEYTMPNDVPDLHVFAALPHMHEIGSAIATVQKTASGDVDLGKRTPWDFKNQIYVPVSATLRPGDRIETRCTWKNDSDRVVGFGPYTSDEMCYSYTLYWPRIPLSSWAWDTPVAHSTCQ